jgi:protein-S-isoprenylcysteine O-methyltransferase Ste14
MTDEWFRNLILVVLGPIVPFAVFYRHRSFTGENLDRWQEGKFILFGTRLSGIPAVIGGMAWMMNPAWMAWSSLPIPLWGRWIGVVLVGLGGLLLVWTLSNLGKNLTDTVATRKDHSLVTSGPYRFVRHPFYLSGLVSLVGGSLATANWFLLLAGLLPLGFLVVRTKTEEQKLIERFGDEYRNYMARTGRFFPRFGRS